MGLRERLEQKDSEELKEIYRENDRNKWPKEAIDMAGKILEVRGEKLPDQSPPKKPDSPYIPDSAVDGESNKPGGFFNFEKLITTKIIGAVYIVGAILIIFGGGVTMYSGNSGAVFVGLIGIIVGNIVWRLVCESAIVIFNMHDKLADLHDVLRDNLHALENIQQTIEEGQEGEKDSVGS